MTAAARNSGEPAGPVPQHRARRDRAQRLLAWLALADATHQTWLLWRTR